MRRAPGSGGIEELPSGRWRYTVTLGGKRHRGTADSKEAAERGRDVLLHVLADRQPSLNTLPSLSLGAWGERWLTRRTNRTADENLRDFRRNVSGSDLGRLPLAEVTARDLRKWVAELQRRTATRRTRGGGWAEIGAPLRPGTVAKQWAVLRTVLGAALEEGIIAINPAVGVKLRVPASSRDTMHYLTPEEIERALALPLSEGARAAYTVAIYTGLRQGELIGLRWSDVHLAGPSPHILVARSHGLAPKSGKRRTVPLLPQALAALQRWRPLAPSSPAGYVWPTPSSDRYGKGHDWHWGTRWAGRAGIQGKTFHALRHTCATALLLGWWGPAWSISEVQVMLGHHSVKITERYTHLTAPHLLAKAAAHYEALVQPTAPAGAPLRLVAPVEDSSAETPRRNSAYLGPATVRASSPFVGASGPDSASELLETIAAGRVVAPELLDRLLDAVAAQHPVLWLARQVEQGGPHMLIAAIKLAEMLQAGASEGDGRIESAPAESCTT